MDLQFSNGNQRIYERILGGQDSVMIAAMPDSDTVLLVREYAVGSDRYEIGLPKRCRRAGRIPTGRR